MACSYYMCVHTLPRELNEVAILSNLLGNVVDHTVHIGCNKLLLESFQFCILPQSHEVFHPLLSLCYMCKGRKIKNNCLHVHPIIPLHECHLQKVNLSRSGYRAPESPAHVCTHLDVHMYMYVYLYIYMYGIRMVWFV